MLTAFWEPIHTEHKIDCKIKEFDENSSRRLNPFLASDRFYRLLITFANSLDPDQE